MIDLRPQLEPILTIDIEDLLILLVDLPNELLATIDRLEATCK